MEQNDNFNPGPYDVKMYAAPAVTIIEQDGLFAVVAGDVATARKEYLRGKVTTWFRDYTYAIAALYDPRGGCIAYDYSLRSFALRRREEGNTESHDKLVKCGLDTITVEVLARRMWYGGTTNMLLHGKTVEVTAMHIIEWMQEKGYVTKTSPVEKYFCCENSEHPIVYEYRPDELHLAILAEESDYIINEIRKDYDRNH